jgi:predicted amidohydrolase YtcJ
MFGEDFTGSIEEGKSAELVVLDADLENTPAEDIYAVKIDKTIFKGKVVFDLASE